MTHIHIYLKKRSPNGDGRTRDATAKGGTKDAVQKAKIKNDSGPMFKAPGGKYKAGTEVEALQFLGGGRYRVRFPGGEAGEVGASGLEMGTKDAKRKTYKRLFDWQVDADKAGCQIKTIKEYTGSSKPAATQYAALKRGEVVGEFISPENNWLMA